MIAWRTVIAEYLREVLRFFVLVFVRPLLRASVFLFSPIYKLVFGPLDERAHQKLE